jgi:shikimate kinase
MTTIIITGISSAGKTTLGLALANKLGYNFIDLDLEIEKYYNLHIKYIIKKYGIKLFRYLEQRQLKYILNNCKNTVIALGGGAFNNLYNQQLCNKKSITLWLNPDINLVADVFLTAKEANSRPLLSGDYKKNLFNLYNNRVKHYKKAKYMLNYNKITDIDLLVSKTINLVFK